uniref:SCP domain-containing protein n=1 Tax=Oryza glumipatula TaxID=40148 RepID=A0A0E0AFG6_9ORYZ
MAWLSSSSRLALCVLVIVAASLAVATPDDYLSPHNVTRSSVGVPAVVWNNVVAAFAANHVAQLNAGGCELQPSGTSVYGENLYYFSSESSSPAADAVASWVSEEQWYNHTTNICSAPEGNSCGHYTQVVWRDSTDIGCAEVVCDNGNGVIVACNYSLKGNIPGQSPY